MTELKRSDFSKICRTCLLQKENMEPIYKSDIPKMLLSFTNIKVQTEDELPKTICADCADQIHKCYLFKQQCETNQVLLEKISLEYGYHVKVEPVSLDPPSPESLLKQMLLKTEVNDYGEEEGSEQNEDNFFNDTSTFYGSENSNLHNNSDTDKKNNFNCQQCGKHFSQKDYLKKHIKRHSAKGLIKEKQNCPICSKAVINVKFHIKMNHSVVKPFKCPECDASFPLNCVLDRHIRFHHRGEKRKKIERLCTLCGKSVYSSTALEYHMRVHAGEHPFMCDVCSKRFNSAAHLKVHKRTHTGEKPYKCVICNKCFVTSNVLKKHIRTHTGERPYVCQICNKAFTQGGVLKTHMRIHS